MLKHHNLLFGTTPWIFWLPWSVLCLIDIYCIGILQFLYSTACFQTLLVKFCYYLGDKIRKWKINFSYLRINLQSQSYCFVFYCVVNNICFFLSSTPALKSYWFILYCLADNTCLFFLNEWLMQPHYAVTALRLQSQTYCIVFLLCSK